MDRKSWGLFDKFTDWWLVTPIRLIVGLICFVVISLIFMVGIAGTYVIFKDVFMEVC